MVRGQQGPLERHRLPRPLLVRAAEKYPPPREADDALAIAFEGIEVRWPKGAPAPVRAAGAQCEITAMTRLAAMRGANATVLRHAWDELAPEGVPLHAPGKLLGCHIKVASEEAWHLHRGAAFFAAAWRKPRGIDALGRIYRIAMADGRLGARHGHAFERMSQWLQVREVMHATAFNLLRRVQVHGAKDHLLAVGLALHKHDHVLPRGSASSRRHAQRRARSVDHGDSRAGAHQQGRRRLHLNSSAIKIVSAGDEGLFQRGAQGVAQQWVHFLQRHDVIIIDPTLHLQGRVLHANSVDRVLDR
mmetsp:Transcript_70295/g.195648  ORF Transcript_70295/g.195648 Transcript_70295/m.195648 type:complete len:303 (+) Transcript_70295:116-1024(+)